MRATAFEPAWAGPARLAEHQMAGCARVTLHGDFQHPAFFERHLDLIRLAFSVPESDSDGGPATVAVPGGRPSPARAAARREDRLRALVPTALRGRPVVAVHYRLGDYEASGWLLTGAYYEEALRALQRPHLLGSNALSEHPVCFIFSDDPARAWARSAALDSVCATRLPAPAEADETESLRLLSMAEAVVVADSTYSYWGAILSGEQLRAVVVPQVQGTDAPCWAYLARPPHGFHASASWLAINASVESPGALLAEEVLALQPLDDADGQEVK